MRINIFRKKDARKRNKEKVEKIFGDDVEILEDMEYGFYIKVPSDYPDEYFLIIDSGHAAQVNQKRERFVQRGVARKFLIALLREVK